MVKMDWERLFVNEPTRKRAGSFSSPAAVVAFSLVAMGFFKRMKYAIAAEEATVAAIMVGDADSYPIVDFVSLNFT